MSTCLSACLHECTYRLNDLLLRESHVSLCHLVLVSEVNQHDSRVVRVQREADPISCKPKESSEYRLTVTPHYYSTRPSLVSRPLPPRKVDFILGWEGPGYESNQGADLILQLWRRAYYFSTAVRESLGEEGQLGARLRSVYLPPDGVVLYSCSIGVQA